MGRIPVSTAVAGHSKFSVKWLASLLSAFLFAFGAMITGSEGSTSLQTIDMQLRWKHQFQFAGYYAAIEKGYYRQEGLEVRLHEGAPEKTPVKEVLEGRAQYGEANSELLYERLKGKPLVALAAIFQHSPSVLLARADANIFSPQDLIGKRIMLMNEKVDADFHAMLLNEGIRPETIEIIPSSFDINDLATGKVAAFNSYLTNEPYFLKQMGIEFNIISPKKYGIDYYSDILFTSEREATRNPSRVKAFRRATLRGWQYAMANQDEIIELLISKYNVKKTREHLQFEAEAMRPLILPDLIEIGHMNPGRWKHMADTFVKAGMIDQHYSLEGFIFGGDPVKEVTRLRRLVLVVSVITVLLILVTVSLFAIQRRLWLENEQRRKTEEDLRESQQQLRLQFDNMPSGCIVIDTSGVITSWNPAANEIFGYSAEEALGRDINSLIMPPESFFDMEAIHHTVVKGDFSVSIISRNRTKDNRLISCEWTNTAFRDKNGDISGMISMVQDMSIRLEHERERLKIEKLESIGVLAGGIAHDFNNILTGIMGNISLARAYMDESHKAFKPLADAEKASFRAGELARQLLSFAKGGSPVKKVVSIRDLLDESLSLMLRGSNVKGAVETDNPLYAVDADEGQISQVFNNIIINAIHAMPEGGVLTVSVANKLLPDFNSLALPGGNYVRITFKDAGCGISEADQIRIFDPYFTTKSEGSGLGLASAQSIVNRHGGNISVDSEPGKGSAFTIYLPSLGKYHTKQEDGGEMPESVIHKGGHILVMDDEEMIRELAAEMLKFLGYEVTTCINGEEALEYYANSRKDGMPYKAVIMDLTIPGGMGGKEAARRILEIDPQAKLIVSSGYSGDTIISDYTDFGFSAAVAKPYRVTELGKVMETLLCNDNRP